MFRYVNLQEQDKSSDIQQQLAFGDCIYKNTSKTIHSLKIGGLRNQHEYHVILTKYEAVQPTAVSENNSSSEMLIV